jgi:uncharacterized protein YjbI with pentapeptide repeats
MAKTKEDPQIARINEISNLARSAFFGMLAYLAFVGLTLLGIDDADFFLSSREAELPLVGIQIPTETFFFVAPVLAAALYAYLHLFLIKLWDAHVPATADDDPTHHWLVNDFVLVMQGNQAAKSRPLSRLTPWFTWLLVWASAPIVLGYAWLRSMPARNELMSLVVAMCLATVCSIGYASWTAARSRLAPAPPGRPRAALEPGTVGIGIFAALMVIGFLRTEGGFGHYVQAGRKLAGMPPEDWLSVLGGARADLTGEQMAPVPEGWRPYDIARHAFREEWCSREGLDMQVCGPLSDPDRPDPPSLPAERDAWRKESGRDTAKCTKFFENLDERFNQAWDIEWRVLNAGVSDANIGSVDLSGAMARGVMLVGQNLSHARLNGATLGYAQMDRANLTGAELRGADLYSARIEGAQAVQADFRRARLTDSNLGGTDLQWSDLREAVLKNADLRDAQLKGAELFGAFVPGADLRGIKDLQQEQLSGVVGNRGTLLPSGYRERIYVWSCAEAIDPGAYSMDAKDEIKDMLCADDTAKLPTGTPCSITLTRKDCLDPTRNPELLRAPPYSLVKRLVSD